MAGRRWLMVEMTRTSLRAVLHTVPHRIPRSVVVPLSVASRLAAAGVPLVVRHLDDADPTPSR